MAFDDYRGVRKLELEGLSPVDSRPVIGHIHPDTDATYDIGRTDRAIRHIVGVSGTFDEVVINSINHSTIPPMVYGIQTSGGPVDEREFKANVIPDTSVAYDFGSSTKILNNVYGTIGHFRGTVGGVESTVLSLGQLTSDSETPLYRMITNDATNDRLKITSTRYAMNFRFHRDSPTGDKSGFALTSYGDDDSHVFEIFGGDTDNNVKIHLRAQGLSYIRGGDLRTLGIRPEINSTYDLGTASFLWRRIDATSGVFTESTINSINHSTIPPIVYGIQTSGGPIDEREFKDHVHPDTNAAYDIGHDSKAIRRIVSISGTFDEVIINSIGHSTIPPIVYGIQTSGGPIDERQFKDHIVPDITNVYDIGTDGLNIRRITATSGVFTESTINSINHSTIPPIIYGIQTSGGPIDEREFKANVVPDTSVAYDFGSSTKLLDNIYGTIGHFRGAVGGDDAVVLNLGQFSDNPTTPLYEIRTDDVGTDSLIIHCKRWGIIVSHKRDSATGAKFASLLGSDGSADSAHYLDIYGGDASNHPKVHIHASGESYISGGELRTHGIRPEFDNTYDLGTSSRRWRRLDAASGIFNVVIPQLIKQNYRSMTGGTGPYVILATDFYVDGDASSEAFVAIMPDASDCAGQSFVIKKIDASANTITMSGAVNIDGSATFALEAQDEVVRLFSIGTNWRII